MVVAALSRRHQLLARKMRSMRDRIEPGMERAIKMFCASQSIVATERLLRGTTTRAKVNVDALLPPGDDGAMMVALKGYYDAATYAALQYSRGALGEPVPQDYSPYVQRQLSLAGQRITAINNATRRRVADLLREGDQRGYTTEQLAYGVPEESFPGVSSLVKETYTGRARTIARTELAYATQAAAIQDWRDIGVQEQMIEDGEEYDEECAARNGTTVPITDDVEPLHPNAILAGTPFTPYGRLLCMMRAHFRGRVIRLVLADGRELAIGPKHPMLTPRGLIPACELRQGDDLVYDRRFYGAAGHAQPYLNQMPLVEDAFASFSAAGIYVDVPAAAHHLHGDGAFCDGEVEVVLVKRPLLLELDTPPFEHGRERDLVRADTELALVTSAGAQPFCLGRVALPSPRGVGGGHVEPVASSQGRVSISSVGEVEYDGFVYDAMTEYSLYCAAGVVVSNCTVVSIPLARSMEATVSEGRPLAEEPPRPVFTAGRGSFPPDDYDAWVEREDAIMARASESQTQARDDYTYGSYAPVNRYLRSGEAVSREGIPLTATESREIRTTIRGLDSLIKKQRPLKEDSVVYRRGYLPSGLKVGDAIIDQGYMSTSANEAEIAPFHGGSMEILLPKGLRVLIGSPQEQEIILPRGSTLVVVKVDPDRTYLRVELPSKGRALAQEPTPTDPGARVEPTATPPAFVQPRWPEEDYPRTIISDKLAPAVREQAKEALRKFPPEVNRLVTSIVTNPGGRLRGLYQGGERTVRLAATLKGRQASLTVTHEIAHAASRTEAFNDARVALMRHYDDIAEYVANKLRLVIPEEMASGADMANLMDIRQKLLRRKDIGAPVTEYALTKPTEYFADTVSYYLTDDKSRALLRRVDPEAYRILAEKFPMSGQALVEAPVAPAPKPVPSPADYVAPKWPEDDYARPSMSQLPKAMQDKVDAALRLYPPEVSRNRVVEVTHLPANSNLLGRYGTVGPQGIEISETLRGRNLELTLTHEMAHAAETLPSFAAAKKRLDTHFAKMLNYARNKLGYVEVGINVPTPAEWAKLAKARKGLIRANEAGKIGGSPVTDYAFSNPHEYVAETMSYYLTDDASRALLARVDPLAYKILSETFPRPEAP